MSTTTPSTGRPRGRASVPGAPSSGAGSSARARARVSTPGRPAVYGGGSSSSSSVPPRTGTAYRGGRKRGPHWGRIALVGGLALLVIGLLAGTGLAIYYKALDSGLNRDDPFAELTGGRPAKTVDGALNLLLL